MGSNSNTPSTTVIPVCPGDPLHGKMVLRTSKYGQFYACKQRCCTMDIKTGRVRYKAASQRKRHKQAARIEILDGHAAYQNYLKARGQLNEYQLAIIEDALGQNVVIRAAAGSGKTTVLKIKIASLILQGVNPKNIIVTTFTRAGADKLKAALAQILPGDYLNQLAITTFHGLALRNMLKIDQNKWSMERCIDVSKGDPRKVRGTSVYPRAWTLEGIVRKRSTIHGLSARGLGMKKMRWEEFDRAITIMRSHGVNLGSKDLADWIKRMEARFEIESLERVWKLFEASKSAQGGFDYTDVLYAWADHLKTSTEYIDNPKAVFVDEAQDNNVIQYTLTSLLAGACILCNGSGLYVDDLDILNAEKVVPCPECKAVGKYPYAGRVSLIGDVNQSIFLFLGAVPKLFLEAEKTFAANHFELPLNYRSPEKIVALGNRVVEDWPWASALKETVRSARPDLDNNSGYRIIGPFSDPYNEAQKIIELIAKNVWDKKIMQFQDCAILARTRFRAGMFECAAMRRGIPAYRMEEASFFERFSVRQFIAMASLFEDRLTLDDATQAYRLSMNAGGYRAHPKTIVPLFQELWKQSPKDIVQISRNIVNALPSGKDRERMREFTLQLDEINKSPWSYAPKEKLDYEELREYNREIDKKLEAEEIPQPQWSMILKMLKKGSGRQEADYLQTVGRMAARFQSYQEFHDKYKRYMNVDPKKALSIGTIHSSKGLEFENVFIPSGDDILGSSRCTTNEEVEEEVRLLYVAVTRAIRWCIFSYTEENIYGDPVSLCEWVGKITSE